MYILEVAITNLTCCHCHSLGEVEQSIRDNRCLRVHLAKTALTRKSSMHEAFNLCYNPQETKRAHYKHVFVLIYEYVNTGVFLLRI